MLRVQAVNVYPQAIGALLAEDARLGRHCVVAEGDPIAPPLSVYVEAPAQVDLGSLERRLHAGLRRPLRRHPARPRLAAGGRAQDPNRPQDGAR